MSFSCSLSNAKISASVTDNEKYWCRPKKKLTGRALHAQTAMICSVANSISLLCVQPFNTIITATWIVAKPRYK